MKQNKFEFTIGMDTPSVDHLMVLKDSGIFNPKEWLWKWECDYAERYNLYITHKKIKGLTLGYDGAKFHKQIKDICKKFGVIAREIKCPLVSTDPTEKDPWK